MLGRERLFGLLLWTPALVPLVCPHPPFQDWGGHLGVIGALIHKDDPAARIQDFYQFTGWLKPNVLFYAIAWALAQVMPPFVVVNLMLALVLGGLAPSVRVLLRAVGGDERLAALALPLALGRIVFCGFIPNAGALSFLMLAYAAYFRLVADPRWWRAALLFAALFMVLGLHTFVYLAGAGLLLILIALDVVSGARRSAAMAIGAVVVSWAGTAPVFLQFEARKGGGPGTFGAIFSSIASNERADVWRELWEWLFATYRYAKIDDVLQGVWVALILLGVILSWRVEGRRLWTGHRGRLVLCAAVALFMFWLLPSYIPEPVNWWGGNLRLPSIVALLLIPAAGPSGRMTSDVLPWAAARLGAVCVALVLFDLGRHQATEMKGLESLIAKIPPGKRVSVLHYTPHHVHEYPGEPYGYVSNYYLLEKGGLVPQNVFDLRDVPFLRKEPAPAPPWGMAQGFSFSQHGAGYDAFLVRTDPDHPDAPFHGGDRDRVEVKDVAGVWRYWAPRDAR